MAVSIEPVESQGCEPADYQVNCFQIMQNWGIPTLIAFVWRSFLLVLLGHCDVYDTIESFAAYTERTCKTLGWVF